MSLTYKLLHGLLLLLVFTQPLRAQPQITNLQELDKAIADIQQRHDVPSVAYTIIDRDNTPHTRVIGVANREAAIPASTKTQYRIASISKVIVGIAVMQLVESGQLALNDKVADRITDLAFANPWYDTHPLRVVHLLENTTGWQDMSMAEFAFHNDPPLPLKDALAINPKSRTSRWPPGTRHAYTNSSAAVSAYLVETVTGMSFYSYVEQFIFKPLGITSATYSEPSKFPAQGYQHGQPFPFSAMLMRPAGALSMSIEDMAKLTQLFVQQGQPLLNAGTIARMETSMSTNAGEFNAGYGIYNYARFYDGWRYRGHDGASRGWLAEMSYSPKHNVGFSVLQNSEQGQSFRQIVNAITAYLSQSFTIQTAQPAQLSEKWRKASGYYRTINNRFVKRQFLERLIAVNKLTIKDNQAVLKSVFPPGWQRQLTYVGGDRWHNNKGELVMVAAIDPVADKVIHYGDRVLYPISAFNAWADKIVLIIWLVLLLGLTVHSFIWPLRKVEYAPVALRARKLTAMANWSAIAYLVLLIIGAMSPIVRLGQTGIISIGLIVSSVVFAVVTVYTTARYTRLRSSGARGVFYVIGGFFHLVQLIVVVYLFWFGAIGMVPWTS